MNLSLSLPIVVLFLLSASHSIFAETSVNPRCSSENAVYDVQQQKLSLPTVLAEQQGLLYKAQLDLLSSQIPYHFQLTDLSPLAQLVESGAATYQSSEQLLTILDLCSQSENTGQSGYGIELQGVPNSQPMQFLLKSAVDKNKKPLLNWPLSENKGALFLADRKSFENLATTSNVSGATGVRELKFVLVDLDTAHPLLFFMNSNETPLHYEFLRNVLNRYQNLNYDQGNTQFTAETYFRESRTHLAGSIVAYDNFADPENNQLKGLFALEFWPTDPVPANLIEKAYRTATAAMSFLPTPLAYHPVGNTHELELAANTEQFATKNICTIHTNALFAQLDSAILNKGEAYGRLKIINPGDPNPGEDVIAIYTFIPNTLGHVGGIITEEPQTPLSHINLKARQNDTPNAYIKNVSTNPTNLSLINQWVHYSITDSGLTLKPATEEESLKWLEGKIPTEVTIPGSDLSETNPLPLTEIDYNDWTRVGVKAANVAELGKILSDNIPPKGYALPFSMYDEFMRAPRCTNNITALCNNSGSKSFYDTIEQLLNNSEFTNNQAFRVKVLAVIRDTIEQAEAPKSLIDKIETVRLFWEPSGEPFEQSLRVRSSTNNEDLEGFNGAGLYESFTHKPKEGQLINSIKQVWASLWTERAFEERRLHRIDHLKTYMGVLIHPNYGDEQANGVAITKNIYNPDWEGFYINAQYGEFSITNPEPVNTENGLVNPVSDEFIITRLPASVNGFAWETLFIRHSNIETVYDNPVSTENVLMDSEMNALRDNLQLIHSHFKELYHGDSNFAMDIEFKITETDDGSRGKLAIKQARPWID